MLYKFNDTYLSDLLKIYLRKFFSLQSSLYIQNHNIFVFIKLFLILF